ncbi:hypothetical protein Q5762_20650 [Streptomyces sp. P9(2023)]|uniref:hypothetical protein n=1 Tax=Streptomyces sp. P9(2023) TaxID=3064394 RepID=UPI0028F3F7B3|nr:hypothetical protein [Streptomyces sp. P9(2023)]MDT9690710.1 hypothetical protein [Streptomyces sp. P9(2023)]
MSTTSPVPVLQGNRGTELRAEGEELVLSRPDEVLRIPFAAIARVRAQGRDVALELTAPALAEPTVYRIEDVSRAAATAFADVVNGALPARPAGEETVDGATLVTIRSLRTADADEDGGEDLDDVQRGLPAPDKWTFYTAAAAVAVLAVVVGVLDRNGGRGIATLLLGELGVGAFFLSWAGLASVWRGWYLPRYGITVDARQVYRNGNTTLAYTDTDGVTHHIWGTKQNGTVRVAYHPRKPNTAVVCEGWGSLVGGVTLFLFITAVAALIVYGTAALALPAFGG